MKGICRVCQLLDKDESLKELIWCNFCQAAMCKDCERNWLRRGQAMIIDKLTK